MTIKPTPWNPRLPARPHVLKVSQSFSSWLLVSFSSREVPRQKHGVLGGIFWETFPFFPSLPKILLPLKSVVLAILGLFIIPASKDAVCAECGQHLVHVQVRLRTLILSPSIFLCIKFPFLLRFVFSVCVFLYECVPPRCWFP